HLYDSRYSPPSPTLFPYTTLFRSSASSWRASVSNESWRCQPIAITTADATPITISGTRRHNGNLELPARALVGDGSLPAVMVGRSEEHTSELQSRFDLVCRLLLEK